jgi:hypothetical protein
MNRETIRRGPRYRNVGGRTIPREEIPKHHGPSIVTSIMAATGDTYSAANGHVSNVFGELDGIIDLAARNSVDREWAMGRLLKLVAKLAAADLTEEIVGIEEAYHVADAATTPAVVRFRNRPTPETKRAALHKLKQEFVCNAEIYGVIDRTPLELVK